VRDKLSELAEVDVQWADDCIGIDTSSLGPGQLMLVENLRFHAGEEKNAPAVAAELRKLADFYLNDAFGACHRAHASIDALPRLYPTDHTAGGMLLAKELEFLQKVTNISERPFVALMGGAKIAGKIEPLEVLVKIADKVVWPTPSSPHRESRWEAHSSIRSRSRSRDASVEATRKPRSCCQSISWLRMT
jgi:phosphoglycerate kinase